MRRSFSTGRGLWNWLSDDKELLLWRQRLRESIAQWERAGREEDALLPRNLLNQAENWLNRRHDDLTEEERRFVTESIAYRKRQHDLEERRLRREIWTWRAITGMVVLSIFLISLALWSSVQEKRSATARYLATQSGGLLSTRQQTAVLLALEALRLNKKASQPRFPPIEQALRQALIPFGGYPLGTYRGSYKRVVASPDRTHVAALGMDGKLHIWNLSATNPASQERIFPGIQGEPSFFQISPANHWILTGEPDTRILRLQRLDQGGRVLETSIPNPLAWAEFSPDDRWLALQGENKEGVQLRDLNTSNLLEHRFDSSVHVTSLAFSPDGLRMATGISNGTVHLWLLGVDKVPAISPPCKEPITGLSFVPGRDLLVAIDRQGTVWRWSWREAGAGWQRLGGRLSNMVSRDLKVSDSGRWLLTWNAKTEAFGRVNLSSDSNTILHVSAEVTAYASKGNLVAYTQGNTTNLFDIEKGEEDSRNSFNLERRVGAVRTIEIRKCCLVAGGDDRTAHLWRLTGGNAVLDATLGGHDDPVEVLGIGSDERWLLTSGRQGRSPRLWNIKSDPTLPTEPLQLSKSELDNSFLAWTGRLVGIRDDRLLAADWQGLGTSSLATGDPIVWKNSLDSLFPPNGLGTGLQRGSFSSDGHRLAIPSKEGIVILNTDSPSPRILTELPTESHLIIRIALDRTGHWVAAEVAPNSPGKAFELIIWKLNQATPIRYSRRGHPDVIAALVFSPDGQMLLSCGRDGVAYLWSLGEDPASEPQILDPGGGEITSAAFTSGWFALASEDRIVRLWRSSKILRDKAPPDQRLEGAAERLTSLAFGPGSWVAAGGYEGTIYLWDREHFPRTPIVVKRHQAPVSTVTFSPDGRWLVSADVLGGVFRWRMREHDLETFACRTVGRNLSQEEWSDFFPGQKYRLTCSDLPPGD